eukprot:Blabericola_migrator_1__2839@NODE_1811_length_3754_cov_41_873068_g1165_i0_p3_GENE_NODE_1811_length_3754_cov_41_873068_g1165_i0NODE_1811_length_3754_cov_41_873068_g1165_i0_p3_ORF_typecomplete_len102_score9_53_NODE_1811_length_3754_cov_41_873068_g1165_i030633368
MRKTRFSSRLSKALELIEFQSQICRGEFWIRLQIYAIAIPEAIAQITCVRSEAVRSPRRFGISYLGGESQEEKGHPGEAVLCLTQAAYCKETTEPKAMTLT